MITALTQRSRRRAGGGRRPRRRGSWPTRPAEEILRWAGRRVRQRLRGRPRPCRTPCWCTWRPRRCPGVDVLFLDTGYHFIETIGTADAVEAVYDVTLRRLLPLQTVAEQDARVRQGPVRPRPRPVLRAAQGRAAEQGADAATRRGPPACAGRSRRPGPTPRSCSSTPSAARSRSRRWPPGPTTTSTPTSPSNNVLVNPLLVRRVPVDRLRALHPQGVAGTGFPSRPLGRPDQDRMWDQYMTTHPDRTDRQVRGRDPAGRRHRVADRPAQRGQDHAGPGAGRRAARRAAPTSRSWTATRSARTCPPASASPGRTGTPRSPGSASSPNCWPGTG